MIPRGEQVLTYNAHHRRSREQTFSPKMKSVNQGRTTIAQSHSPYPHHYLAVPRDNPSRTPPRFKPQPKNSQLKMRKSAQISPSKRQSRPNLWSIGVPWSLCNPQWPTHVISTPNLAGQAISESQRKNSNLARRNKAFGSDFGTRDLTTPPTTMWAAK